MGAGGAVTVTEQKLVKKYGSIEAGRQYQSEEKAFQTERTSQVKLVEAQIAAASQNLSSSNKAYVKGQQSKVTELKKLLAELKGGVSYQDVSTVIQQVDTFAKEVESVEAKNIRIKAKNKKAREAAKESITQTTTAPETISYTGGATASVIQPGQPVYADIDDINSGVQAVYTDVAKTSPVTIAKTYSKTAYVATPDIPVFLAERAQAPVAPIVDRSSINAEVISMNANSAISNQTQTKPSGLSVKTFPNINNPEDIPKVEKTYDYGQGTSMNFVDLDYESNVKAATQRKQIKDVKQYIKSEKSKDIITGRTSAIKISDKLDIDYYENPLMKKYYDKASSEIKGQASPSLLDIQGAGDNRNTAGTIFNLGETTPIGGADISYATSRKLSEKLQEDFEQSYTRERKALESKIDKVEYQRRIDEGEDFETISLEYEQEVNAANKKLDNYAAEYEATRGKKYRKILTRIQADTNLLGKTKDVQSKIAKLFGTGAATGAGMAVVTTAAVAAAPVIMPVITGAGLIAGGAATGIAIGKAVATGEDIYESSLSIGFSKEQSVQRGLLGASTDIAPFAAVSAGAMVGGIAMGMGLRAARKPIIERKAVGTNRQSFKAEGVKIKETTIKHADGRIEKIITYPKQQISEYSVKGSRAETTNWWRKTFNAKPISRGYPSDKRGNIRAIKILREYGSTKADAKATLKFIKPKVITQTIEYGKVTSISNSKEVFGNTLVKESRIAMTIDKAKGIKTATGKDVFIKDEFIRTGATNKNKITNFMEVGLRDVGFRDGGKIIYTKNPVVSIRIGSSASGDKYTGLMSNPNTDVSSSNIISIKPTGAISVTKRGPSTYGSKGKTYLIGEGNPDDIIFESPASRQTRVFRKVEAPIKDVTSNIKLESSNAYKNLLTTTDSKAITIKTLTNLPIELSSPTTTAQFVPPPLISPYYNTAYLAGQVQLGIAVATISQDVVIPKLDSIQSYGLISKTLDSSSKQKIATEQLDELVSGGEGGGGGGGGKVPELIIPDPIIPPTPGVSFGVTIILPDAIPIKISRGGQTAQLFQGQVMQGGKYQTVPGKPKPRSAALDTISRIIDNTTSAQGRIVPTGKRIPIKDVKKGDGYYKRNETKFRNFSIVKGRKVNRPNTIIEKRNKRMDMPGEVSGITFKQHLARSQKRAAGLPTRQSRSKKKKTPYRL